MSPGQFRLFTPTPTHRQVVEPKTMPPPKRALMHTDVTPARRTGEEGDLSGNVEIMTKQPPLSEGGIPAIQLSDRQECSHDTHDFPKKPWRFGNALHDTKAREIPNRGVNAWDESSPNMSTSCDTKNTKFETSMMMKKPNHSSGTMASSIALGASNRPPGMSDDDLSQASDSSRGDSKRDEGLAVEGSKEVRKSKSRSLAGLKQTLISQSRQQTTVVSLQGGTTTPLDTSNIKDSFFTGSISNSLSREAVIDLTPTDHTPKVHHISEVIDPQQSMALFCPFCGVSTNTSQVNDHFEHCDKAQSISFQSAQHIFNAVALLKSKLHDNMELTGMHGITQKEPSNSISGHSNIEVENVLTLDNGKFGCCLCKRTFGTKRSALSHSRACRSVFSEKRSTFDAATKRVKGTPLEFIETYQKSPLLHGGRLSDEETKQEQHPSEESPNRKGRQNFSRGTPPRHPTSTLSHTKQYSSHRKQNGVIKKQQDQSSLIKMKTQMKPLQAHQPTTNSSINHHANHHNIMQGKFSGLEQQPNQPHLSHHNHLSRQAQKNIQNGSVLPEVKGALQIV